MEAMNKLNTVMLLFLLLSSCEKDELPVKPYDRGELEEVVVALNADYSQQVWFDLGSGQVMATNNKLDWDFAWDCRDSSHFIYLNNSVVMMAASTGNTDFSAPIDESALRFRPDHSSGIEDSLALGRWWEKEEVFILDLGFRLNGNPRGKRKIKFELVDNQTLAFTIANLDGSDEFKGQLTKEKGLNSIAYSIPNRSPIQIEPSKEDYDLLFTQYTYAFYQPYTPYLVTGVLVNPHQTYTAEIRHKSFEDVTLDDALNTALHDSLDLIGYDWKYYDFQTAAFTIFTDRTFIIQDGEGFYYKLRFTDFYSESGERGYPAFQYQRI